ncbi:transposase family protein [Streptomyces sp. NPDC002845]
MFVLLAHQQKLGVLADATAFPDTVQQQLQRRFFQDFLTADRTETPLNKLLIPLVKVILTAPTGSGFGFAVPPDNIPAQGSLTARAHLEALGALADLGFRGLDKDIRDPVIVTGFHASRTHKLTPGQKTANRVLAIGRALVEHGFAHLKNWRTLTKLRTDPAHATRLLRALLVLTNLEAVPESYVKLPLVKHPAAVCRGGGPGERNGTSGS